MCIRDRRVVPMVHGPSAHRPCRSRRDVGRSDRRDGVAASIDLRRATRAISWQLAVGDRSDFDTTPPRCASSFAARRAFCSSPRARHSRARISQQAALRGSIAVSSSACAAAPLRLTALARLPGRRAQSRGRERTRDVAKIDLTTQDVARRCASRRGARRNRARSSRHQRQRVPCRRSDIPRSPRGGDRDPLRPCSSTA